MQRRRIGMLVGVAALAAAGLGVAVAASGSSRQPTGLPGATGQSSYSYYRSIMGNLSGGSMMGSSSYDWMTGGSGYRWMTGGTSAPGWMRGATLPDFIMGAGRDPGKAMGAFWADAPGPRVSASEALRLNNRTPAGATVDTAARRITFTSRSAQLVVLASPSMPAEDFRIAGIVDPTIVVPAGAKVSIEVVNADSDMAHGLVVTGRGAASSWMPMMTAAPAFPGSALWFLGESTSAGMHAGTLDFTATTPGTYQYLCPVPGHAREGMVGTFVVSSAG